MDIKPHKRFSVFQLNMSQSQQHYAELSQFKQNSWDYRGVSPSFEVSEGPLFFFSDHQNGNEKYTMDLTFFPAL